MPSGTLQFALIHVWIPLVAGREILEYDMRTIGTSISVVADFENTCVA